MRISQEKNIQKDINRVKNIAMQDAPCLLVDMGRADTGIFIKPESEIIDMTGYANQLKDIPWAHLEVLSRVVPGVPGSMLREAGDVLPPLPKQHKEFLSDIPTKKGRAYGKGYFQYANTPVFEDTPKDIPPYIKIMYIFSLHF